MIKSKKQMFTVIGVFLLIMLLGTVTYAFFNYTRTGGVNTFRTGRIYFNSTQNNTLIVTDIFPLSSEQAAAQANSLSAVTVHIQGDTTYAQGEEFKISLVSVNNTVGESPNQKTLPMNYMASYALTSPLPTVTPAPVIGDESSTYYSSRGSTNAVYHLNSFGAVNEGAQVLVGYIPSGAAGIDGTLTLRAYVDGSRVAISDTYNGPSATPNADMGTTHEWVNGREVFTTEEWNSLQSSETPVSFRIMAESNEGTWVTPATLTLASSSGTVTIGTPTTVNITSNGTGTRSCYSSDTTKATCSVSGTTLTINGVAAGTATITVREDPTATHSGEASATYTATIAS